MAHLLFFRGEEKLIEYRLPPGRTTIGRADSCDVALPGDSISRTHCFVDRQDSGFQVIDRSRHGIQLNGQTVKKADLEDGSEICMGPYRIQLKTGRETPGPTAEPVHDHGHEVVVNADGGSLVVERAVLIVEEGPDADTRRTLRRSRMSLGRHEGDIRLRDPGVVEDHCFFRVSRGRVMVEPGKGAVYLDGERIREITPLYSEEILQVGTSQLRVERTLEDEQPFARRFGEMVGESPAMQKLFGVLRRMAGHHFPVLISGPSGTGKELAARGIHEHSARSGGAFVALNCGAIAESLFESELFGHEKGAFTGATVRKDGAFHAAHGGTLFLDEVGELPEAAQAKLLRALESGEVRRVGSTEVEYPDVRVLAATNRDLIVETDRGGFREDLFFRLNVLSVSMPSLRSRPSDLPLLCNTICSALHPEAHVTDEALAALKDHAWPGNVRELRNVLTRAYVLGGTRIEAEELSFHDLGQPMTQGAATGGKSKGTLKDAQRAFILGVLEKHDHNRSATARELGIARSTLHYKLKMLGIQ
jgi:two-component system response regulator HydG